MSPENVLISGLVPRQHREDLTAIGAGNLSEGLRAAVAAGITSLAGSELPSLERVRDDILCALHRLQQHTTGTLPSGAIWAAAPDRLPDPGTVVDPTVIATPAGVLVVGHGALLVDALAGEVALMTGSTETRLPMNLAGLAQLAAELPAALVTLANRPAVTVKLGCGMTLSRDPKTSAVVMQAGTSVMHVAVSLAWTLAAEVVALAARALADGAEIRVGLEAALDASPSLPPLPVTVHD